MSLRGARDITSTKNLKASGFFVHPKSFLGKDGHLRLFGQDKARVRTFVFKLHKNKCCVCGAFVAEFGEPGFCGEWHHIGKCDCATKECSEVRCGEFVRDCHHHGTVGFKRKAPKQQTQETANGDTSKTERSNSEA